MEKMVVTRGPGAWLATRDAAAPLDDDTKGGGWSSAESQHRHRHPQSSSRKLAMDFLGTLGSYLLVCGYGAGLEAGECSRCTVA